MGQYEKVDEAFFDFINELAKVGSYARSEQSHSDFVAENTETAKQYINEYGELLEKVNKKFEKLKTKALQIQ
jgi:hypothetical protein